MERDIKAGQDAGDLRKGRHWMFFFFFLNVFVNMLFFCFPVHQQPLFSQKLRCTVLFDALGPIGLVVPVSLKQDPPTKDPFFRCSSPKTTGVTGVLRTGVYSPKGPATPPRYLTLKTTPKHLLKRCFNHLDP